MLNAGATVAREHGLTVGYHNHWQEFDLVEGRPAYEHMLERLDPEVFLEVDTYWAMVAEHRPEDVIASWATGRPCCTSRTGPAVRTR